MLRALHKSKLPVWHTEGFNPHPFATFPLPLSLGFRGVNECMDVKLEDENYSFEEIISKLNACLPRGIRVFDVTEPEMKAGKIAYAGFTLKISGDKIPSGKICDDIKKLLAEDKIELEKKSKKGMKTVDIKPGIKSCKISEMFDYAVIDAVLSAGSSDNVNPNLLVAALQNLTGCEYNADITRNNLYDAQMRQFR